VDLTGLLAGSGFAAGLNLYLVTLLLGIAGRLDWADIPEALQRTDVMITAGVLYAVEFVADKVPYVDNLWDGLHTLIRPVGAAALGYVLAGDVSSIGQGVSAAVMGALALSAHSAKATTRAAVNTSPEPFSNIALSLFEDGLAAGLVALALQFPAVAIVVVVILVVAAFYIVNRLWRALGRLRGKWSARAA